jgi:hypothetical protein
MSRIDEERLTSPPAPAGSDRDTSAGARVQNGFPPVTDHQPRMSLSVLNATPADGSAAGVRL